MRTKFALVFVAALGVGVLLGSDAVSGKEPALRFSAEQYPQMAQRVELFEVRFNAKDPKIRRRALLELTYFRSIPSKAYVRFLRALMEDPDPIVAGRAVQALHGMWVPLAPAELPVRFAGYHNDHLVTRDDPKALAKLLRALHGGDAGAGYAAYVAGLLRVKEAVPALQRLAERGGVFPATTAARALADLGRTAEARAAFDAISKEQVRLFETPPEKPSVPDPTPGSAFEIPFYRPGPSPHYALLASRGLAEMGGAWRAVGIDRLIRIYAQLTDSTTVDHYTRVHGARMHLYRLTGQYFMTPAAARAWFEDQKR